MKEKLSLPDNRIDRLWWESSLEDWRDLDFVISFMNALQDCWALYVDSSLLICFNRAINTKWVWKEDYKQIFFNIFWRHITWYKVPHDLILESPQLSSNRLRGEPSTPIDYQE